MSPLTKSTLLKYYKRRDIQEALIRHATNKEIGVCYGEGYGKRPDILTYPQEVLDLALNNATSFHCSEELWSNPLQINSTLSKADIGALRIGWDLVLDIDCAVVEYSKLCAELIIKFLQYCDVKDISIKFSGNKGFHIGIPFEAFPQQIKNVPTKDLFPEAPRRIALYIKENIADALGKRILEYEQNNIAIVAEKVKLPLPEILISTTNEEGHKITKLNVEKFLEIDTVLLSTRHLYRMPYSLHEKSGLVSLPLNPAALSLFEKPMAAPEKVTTEISFLPRAVSGESARRLLLQAWDYQIKEEKKELSTKPKDVDELVIQSPITEEFFPPCIKMILQGMEDGKKRSIFCVSNFLGKIGWNKQEIENYIHKWNTEKNRVPLREVYIKGQLHHFQPKERLPPNCDTDGYYKTIGVCHPDSLCSKIKNPVNYTVLRWKRHLQDKADEEEKGKRGRKKKIENIKNKEKKDEKTNPEADIETNQPPKEKSSEANSANTGERTRS